jgi:hypothetical protein
VDDAAGEPSLIEQAEVDPLPLRERACPFARGLGERPRIDTE